MISRSLKHISNAVTNPTNWFVAACFGVCLFSTMRLLDTRTISISQTADAAEVAADSPSRLRADSKAEPTQRQVQNSVAPSDGSLSAFVKSKTVLTPIEELEVGMRVRADSPNGEFDDQFGTEVIPSEWRKLTLTSPKKNGTLSHITLLRPLDWIEREKAVVDGQVYIRVPECGIDGNAVIHSIEPCPDIPIGEGQVITGTFRHQAEGGFKLAFKGEPAPILCTGNHPFWSETRRDFVRADQLQPFEQLVIANGQTNLLTTVSIEGAMYVYNVEVHRAHVYHVGYSGILVHNGDECEEIIDAAFALDKNGDLFAFAKTVQESTGRVVDAGWFLRLVKEDLPLVENLRQAMAKSGRNHFSFENFDVDDFLDFLKKGGAGSTPYNGSGNVTNWELYTLFTEHLRKTRFYTAKGSNFLPWPF